MDRQIKEEDPRESPPLTLLDPSRIQNPLGDVPHLQTPPASQQTAFVMPEQPRMPPQPPAMWQRTPTMSPANVFPAGSGTPGSQRSSTGTPNQQMGGPQQQQQQPFFHESPAHSQSTPRTPQSAGGLPGSAQGTPQSGGSQAPPPSGQLQYDYQAVQMQQQQQAQAMAQAQQFAAGTQQMHEIRDSPYRGHPQMMGMHPPPPQQHIHPGPPVYPPGYPPAQWQIYARQQQAQHQQRVVQRVPVPYPQGAYPAGMAPGPMTPVYPPQPSPATRTTPGSGGPPTGPPGTPQRPQYPPGANPQAQFAYPPPQQITPTAGAPVPGFPGTPAFNSPAPHQIYRPGPPTGPPGMRPQYISPQQQPTPGTPHRFAPQTPSAATASPHFAPAPGQLGPDLRSPTLMSPTQQQVMQQAQAVSQQHTPVLPRVLHNEMGVAPHGMRPLTLPPPQQPSTQPPQGTPQPPLSAGGPQFFPRPGPPPQMHHDPNTFPMPAMNPDPELFLAGFHIQVFDVEKLIDDRLDKDNLEFMVKYHGGEIEFDMNKYTAANAAQTTHVLVDSYRNPNARNAHQMAKRFISMHWLTDVLERQKVDLPWKLAHLPGPFDGFRPYMCKLFSLSGFDESERQTIGFMADAMGAKISPFLSKMSDLLIAKCDSEKVQKAREWRVPVVNYQWMADTYVCPTPHAQERPNVENPRYQLGQPCSEVNTNPAIIEMAGGDFANMMRCWKQAMIISEQMYEKARQTRESVLQDKYHYPAKRLVLLDENGAPVCEDFPPTDDQIEANRIAMIEHEIAYAKEKAENEEKAKVIVPRELTGCGMTKQANDPEKHGLARPQEKVFGWFGDGFDEPTLEGLRRKMVFLGGVVVDSIQKATHVILSSGRRSTVLLECIIRGKNIVQPEWILYSYRYKRWLDTLQHFLNDEKLEAELSYSCRRSVLRARHRRVFEDIEFYVTRFVEPSQQEIVRLIELAGGIVHQEKPEPSYLAKCIESEQPFIIVSCEVDARFLSYLAESRLPIYNVDLVLFALLRQHIEPLPQYRIPMPIIMKTPVFRQPPPYQQC
ncbi:unnamed protein product [Caenorhabditis sp. 36 PRJEB53466]|nr:unnamed protein product [Caenorhabditis sp. 36 PRJEB53466]